MSNIQHLSNSLKVYNDGVVNLEAKIAQDRRLHMLDLGGIYADALIGGATPEFLNFMEQTIGNRFHANRHKTTVDAHEWMTHDTKLNNALKQQRRVLNGGAQKLRVYNDAPQLTKRMRYAAKRSNGLVWNLNKKLQSDRVVQLRELSDIALAGGAEPFAASLTDMVDSRKLFNSRKTALDTVQWQQLEQNVGNFLGSQDSVLKAGAVALTGGGKTLISSVEQQNLRDAWRAVVTNGKD